MVTAEFGQLRDNNVVCGASIDSLVGCAVRVVMRQDRTCPECPHFNGEHGRTGRVVSMRPTPGAQSHPYLVILDKTPASEAVLDWRLAIVARHYAADELEPIRHA